VIVRRPWLAAALGMLVTASPAAAHSLLLESVPAAGATLSAPPTQLMLRFNNRVEKALSRLRLVDEHGAEQPLAITVASGAADRLSAPVPALAPGRWRVQWQVLSTDGHVVSGSFDFTLRP